MIRFYRLKHMNPIEVGSIMYVNGQYIPRGVGDDIMRELPPGVRTPDNYFNLLAQTYSGTYFYAELDLHSERIQS